MLRDTTIYTFISIYPMEVFNMGPEYYWRDVSFADSIRSGWKKYIGMDLVPLLGPDRDDLEV